MATTLKDRLARQANSDLHLAFEPAEREEPRLLKLRLDAIEPDPDQPRKDLGDLTELADSIREQGVLQPLIVEPTAFNSYRLLAGERRHAACRIAGLATAPCIVRTVEEHERLALQLIENLHRKALNPLEEATAFQRLLDEFNLTQRELAQRLGKSVASVNQTLRLLDLSPEFRASVQTSEQPSKSVLLEIAKEPDADRQRSLLQAARTGGLTVRAAKQRKQQANPNPPPPNVHSIELGEATVTIRLSAGSMNQARLIAVLEEALTQLRAG